VFEVTIYRLINHEFSLAEFEQWVYSDLKLESILETQEYLELISLNYKTPSSLYDAEKILKKYINIGQYHKWRVTEVLKKVMDRPSDVHKYIEECYELYCEGFSFLENLGIGYGLAITVLPSDYKCENWSELNHFEQCQLIDSFYPNVAEEAKRVIGWLDSGKVVITGHDGSYLGIKYDDYRTENDIITTATKKWW
jgi:hypothetical protein